jgi:lipoate-protein ligase A
MKTWFCYPTISAPMPFQMALDEVLFRGLLEKQITGPILRFYYSSEPWITVGYSHPASEFSKDSKLPVCRRMTGGGRVEHGKDLVMSLLGRKEDDDSFGSVRVSYWKIHEAVKEGYEALGQAPRFFRCDEKLPRGGNCFAFPIATDLALGNEKIAGGAQKRSSGVFLHQESLKLASLEVEALREALGPAFEKVFGIKLENQNAYPAQLAQAKGLSREKYERDWAVGTEVEDTEQEEDLVSA